MEADRRYDLHTGHAPRVRTNRLLPTMLAENTTEVIQCLFWFSDMFKNLNPDIILTSFSSKSNTALTA